MWDKFNLLLMIIFLSLPVSGKETTVSVSVRSKDSSPSVLDGLFKAKALEVATKDYLDSIHCSYNDYIKKKHLEFPDKKLFDEYENKVASSFQILYLSGEKANDFSSEEFSARVTFDFNDELVKTNCFLWAEDLKEYQDLLLFFDVNLEYSGNLSLLEKKAFRDFSTIDYFFDLWHPQAIENFKTYPEIALMDQLTKQKVSRYFDYLHENNSLIYFKIIYEKNFENSKTKRIEYRLKNHLVIKHLKTDSIIFTYVFPVQKKSIEVSKVKNISKIIAEQSIKELSNIAPKLDLELARFLSKNGKAYLITINHISSVTDANLLKDLFEQKLNDLEVQVGFNRISSSELILELKSNRGVDWSGILKERFTKVPFKEKKLLVFDAISNSFAIIDN